MKLHDENEAEQRVERETLLPASPSEVWEALTDPERLEEWLAPEVELDAVEGGRSQSATTRAPSAPAPSRP